MARFEMASGLFGQYPKLREPDDMGNARASRRLSPHHRITAGDHDERQDRQIKKDAREQITALPRPSVKPLNEDWGAKVNLSKICCAHERSYLAKLHCAPQNDQY
jgi:hypothetical protein